MKRRTLAWSICLSILAIGCETTATGPASGGAAVRDEAVTAHPEGYGEGLAERAAELSPEVRAWLPAARHIAATTIITDTHIDVPYRVERRFVDVTEATDDGDFDYPRALAGGLDAPFMSIYIPAEVDAADGGVALAERLIASVRDIAERAPERFAMAYSPEDVVANWRAGRISLPMGMENCGPIRDVAQVQRFFDDGIRYCSLAHSRTNALSDSSYDINEQWDGLSPLGEEMVGAMNDAGIMLDVSHLSDAATRELLALTAVPVIASHSSVRHYIPGFQRNLDDGLIRAIGENGGVIMINFGSTFVSQASRRHSERGRMAFQQFLNEAGVAADSEQATAFRERWAEENPFRRATLDEVLDHFDHVAGIAGVKHVGIGSDYDGVGDTLPNSLMDVASYPHLIAGLLSRGYSEAEVRGILSGNLLRVWRAALAYGRGATTDA